jgi:hypothetical protein
LCGVELRSPPEVKLLRRLRTDLVDSGCRDIFSLAVPCHVTTDFVERVESGLWVATASADVPGQAKTEVGFESTCCKLTGRECDLPTSYIETHMKSIKTVLIEITVTFSDLIIFLLNFKVLLELHLLFQQ